jgi:hypothetical protein
MTTKSRLCFFVLFCSLCAKGFGFYSGNPAFFAVPCEGPLLTKEAYLGFKVGALVDKEFERRLQGKGHHQEISQLAMGGLVSALFYERVEIQAGAGGLSADVELEQRVGGAFRFKTHTNPYGHAGAKVVLYQKGQRGLSLGVKGLGTRSKIRSITQNGASRQTGDGRLHMWEAQATLAIFYLLDGWVPYLGIKGSEMRLKLKHLDKMTPFFPSGSRSLSNKHKVDLVLGVGFSKYAALGFNVELRALDDKALTLTGEIRF